MAPPAGEAYFNGMAGERFAVRNSGATAVVEGVGDHGCEYMTNGTVVILGGTGRNFAAGMSGGIAYVFDEDGEFAATVATRQASIWSLYSTRKISRCCSSLIQQHVEYTGSPRGKWMLENWAEMLPKFVKVFPHEYKRVLGVQRTKTEQGTVHASVRNSRPIAVLSRRGLDSRWRT